LGHAGAAGAIRCGCSAQPATTRIAAAGNARVRKMWVIYLEMGLAFALLILIVWWTWPAKRPEQAPKEQARKEEAP
jgi:H+/gluconate symporter-like permease